MSAVIEIVIARSGGLWQSHTEIASAKRSRNDFVGSPRRYAPREDVPDISILAQHDLFQVFHSSDSTVE